MFVKANSNNMRLMHAGATVGALAKKLEKVLIYMPLHPHASNTCCVN